MRKLMFRRRVPMTPVSYDIGDSSTAFDEPVRGRKSRPVLGKREVWYPQEVGEDVELWNHFANLFRAATTHERVATVLAVAVACSETSWMSRDIDDVRLTEEVGGYQRLADERIGELAKLAELAQRRAAVGAGELVYA